MRVWHNGCAPAFQAGYTGSTPVTRSNFGGIPEWPKGADCKSASTSFDGSNPSPTTILNFRRPLDGFLLLLSVKVPVSNLGLTPTKWWWDFSWYTFGTQMVHKILCRQRCKNGKGLPSRPERNFLFQDEGPGSFQETARYIRNPACSQRFQLEYCCSKE